MLGAHGRRHPGGRLTSPLDPRILDEAADWLLRLNAGDVSDADRSSCEHWRAQSPEHARAWARAEMLMKKVDGLPVALAMPALNRPAAAGRRAALGRLGKLTFMLAALPAGWAAWRQLERTDWGADYRSAAGERRELQLADGTRLTLNTATAVDVRFKAGQRLILLRAGELLVQTGHDGGGRPLRVITRQGRMEPLGTRFTVRQEEELTRIAVFEGAVRIDPGPAQAAVSGPASLVLQAGEQTSFTDRDVAPVHPADAGAAAWTRGMLLADDMPLVQLAAELSRYRRGVVQCDPAVAALRVTGSFPVGSEADTARTLAMLVATYPVAAQLRLGGLWVTLAPRNP